MPVIRVLLADDYALFRHGVASLLELEPEFLVVGEAEDGAQAVERARELLPDVVLMDVSMPAMDGLEATRRITAELPSVKVVVVTVHDSPRARLEAARSGAASCHGKTVEPQALYAALREAAAGHLQRL